MRIIRYPCFFRNAIKRINTKEKVLYITFDDGPTVEITVKVLEILEKYKAEATFFCLGENANKFPKILEKIKTAGHTIGNHGYSHKNAFKTTKKLWLENAINYSLISDSQYFRPPYGNIYPSQFHKLSKKYKIILWDVLSYDFDKNLSPETIQKIILKYIRNGSIIVFHDTDKAAKNMFPTLQFTLKHFSELGFVFKKL